MTGYKDPPKHTQYKPGQTGNSRGRPKKRGIHELFDTRSASAFALREAERPIKVKEGEEIREMPAIRAMLRSQLKSGLSGNSVAQRDFIARYDVAHGARRLQIAEDVKLFSRSVEIGRKKIADAEARGEPEPVIYPHPDDIEIDHEEGVSFHGPIDEEQAKEQERTAKFRDNCLLQWALDERLHYGKLKEGDPTLDRTSGAYLFAYIQNECFLSRRYQISEWEMQSRLMTYRSMTKRALLKNAYRKWREVGVAARRGAVFPSCRVTKGLLESSIELLEGLTAGRTI